MKNILFATVRQGNCGDEFILFGTQNIVSSLQPQYNAIILNKNVEVCRRLQFRKKSLDLDIHQLNEKVSVNLEKLCFGQEPLHDDSFADYYSLDFIDAVVFAGTPEWVAYKLIPLYEKLESYRGPIFFLGLGYHEGFDRVPYSRLEPVFKKIHKKASALIVRDRLILDYLKPEINAVFLPCPALFSSPHHKKIEKIEKIGFTLQAKSGDAKVNSVPDHTYYFSLKLLEEISKYYEVEVVCHWIEDLIYLHQDLGEKYPLRYSYDAKNYLDIYDSYDLVISTRIHGAGMAASLGIPSLTISHSARTDTVRGFLSRTITTETEIKKILETINNLDVQMESMKIIAHKESMLNSYKDYLRPFFPL